MPTTPSNLFQYYQSQGQALPSVQQRQTLAGQAGIQGYTGSAAQNAQLLQYLTSNGSTGSGGGSNTNQNGSVNANQLNNTNPLNIPPPQNSMGGLNAMVASVAPELQTATQNQATAESSVNQGTQDIATLLQQLGNQTADQNQAEVDAGLPQLNKDLLDLQNVARQKNIEYQTTPYSLQGQGRGVTTGILRGQEAVKQRQIGIDLLITNSNIQAKMGNIQMAQNLADKAVAAKYEPLKAEIEAKKFTLDANYKNLSRADQKLADVKKQQWDLQLKQIDQQQQNASVVQNIALKAIENGAPASVVKAIQNSTDINSAMTNAGQYLATADTDIIKLDNGNTIMVDKRTGNVIKNFGGSSNPTPSVITRSINGQPVDGYTVVAGDDPYFIAQQHGTDMAGLQAVNPQIKDWHNVQPGAVINIPKSSQDSFVSTLLGTKGGKALTDTTIQKLDKGLTVLGQLGVLQQNIKDVQTGPLAGAFKSKNPWDTKGQTIKAQLNAIVPNLARGVYGEVGVLTDNDIKTYSKTLPNLTSTEAVRNAVLYITLDMIGKSISNTLSVNAAAGRDVSGFVDIYTEMQNTKNSILSTIPNAQVPQAFQSQNTDPFLSQFSPSSINQSLNNSAFFNQF